MSASTGSISASKEALSGQILSPFIDGWIIMLCLGGLAHHLSIPRLALDYWSCVLTQVIALALLPSTFTATACLRQLLKVQDREQEAKR